MDDSQIERFSRHILLREVGPEGQEALLAADVSVPMLDVAGRACALWLARAGIGSLALPADRSPAPSIDPAGLLHRADAGRPVGEVVRERLAFHAPGLRFGSEARLGASLDERIADPVERGCESALAVIRTVLSGASA